MGPPDAFSSNSVDRVLKFPTHRLLGKSPFLVVQMTRSALTDIINPSCGPFSLCQAVHSFGEALKCTNEDVIASADSKKPQVWFHSHRKSESFPGSLTECSQQVVLAGKPREV